jgi:hypothetical protein
MFKEIFAIWISVVWIAFFLFMITVKYNALRLQNNFGKKLLLMIILFSCLAVGIAATTMCIIHNF